MSRMLIITRPSLVPGFHLAGVNAFGVEDVESAQELILSWLSAGEVGLLAIDDGLLALMNRTILKRLEAYEQLPYLPIPGGRPLAEEATRKHRIAEMIRRAIGFHITFKGEEAEGQE